VSVDPPSNESASKSVASARSPSDAASKTVPSVWSGEKPVAAHASRWVFQKPGVQPSSPGGVVVLVVEDDVVDDDVVDDDVLDDVLDDDVELEDDVVPPRDNAPVGWMSTRKRLTTAKAPPR
jgi:hypothetical protein